MPQGVKITQSLKPWSQNVSCLCCGGPLMVRKATVVMEAGKLTQATLEVDGVDLDLEVADPHDILFVPAKPENEES